MKIYDISLPITITMPVWPNDPPVEMIKLSSFENGDQVNVTQLKMSVHTGTHIDAPKHFHEDGITIDQIPLKKLIGETLVMNIDESEPVISARVLASHPSRQLLGQATKVLFQTKNSSNQEKSFNKGYVAIDSSGAEFLGRFNLDLIGVDYLSIATFSETDTPHKVLLSKEIVLLEGINLTDVVPGIYHMYCLPLNIAGCEGAPARAILQEIRQ